MHIPKSKNRKALIIVDVQPFFIKKRDSKILENILKLLKQETYDCYANIVFFSEGNPEWEEQEHWKCPEEYAVTVPEVMEAIRDKKVLHIKKSTKSAFKGEPKLEPWLKENKIHEVHIIGFDTNDCVFVTANEAFDLGFKSYVIEEATGSSEGEKYRREAIDILRELNMTNHSVV